MSRRTSPLLAFVALFVLAPLLSVVLITTLLLAGVDPHSVFLPGHLLKTGLRTIGIRAPNAAGVLFTGVVWWAVILVVWLALRRLRRTGV